MLTHFDRKAILGQHTICICLCLVFVFVFVFVSDTHTVDMFAFNTFNSGLVNHCEVGGLVDLSMIVAHFNHQLPKSIHLGPLSNFHWTGKIG